MATQKDFSQKLLKFGMIKNLQFIVQIFKWFGIKLVSKVDSSVNVLENQQNEYR